MKNLILGGTHAEVYRNIPSIKMGDNARAIIVIGFTDGHVPMSKVSMASQANLWDRCLDIDRQLRTKLNAEPITIHIFGPYVNGKEVYGMLREKMPFKKDKTWQMEYVNSSAETIAQALSEIDIAKIDVNFVNQKFVSVPVSSALKINQNRRKMSKPLAQTVGTINQFKSACEFNYPMPTEVLPELSVKNLIRMRVANFVDLTTEYYFDPESEEFHFAWKNLWRFVDTYYPDMRLMAEHRRLQSTGYKGSVLDLAEKKGVLDKVYAVAVAVFYKEPEMPQLINTGVRMPFAIDAQVPVDRTAITTFQPEAIKHVAETFSKPDDVSRVEMNSDA